LNISFGKKSVEWKYGGMQQLGNKKLRRREKIQGPWPIPVQPALPQYAVDY